MYGLLDLSATRKIGRFAAMMCVMAVISLVPFSFRFLDDPLPRRYYFTIKDAERAQELKLYRARPLRILDDDRFYAVDPALVQGIVFPVVGLAGLLAIVRIRKSRAARFSVASMVVVAAAVVPYTGWLLGLAITPFHLLRVLWLTPFGVIFAFLVQSALGHVSTRFPRVTNWLETRTAAVAMSAAGTIAVLILPGFMLSHTHAPFLALDLPRAWTTLMPPPAPGQASMCNLTYQDMKQIGAKLQEAISGHAIVLGDEDTNDLLPAVSAKAKLVYFRATSHTAVHLGSMDYTEAGRRRTAWRAMIGEATPSDVRLDLLRAYKVRFILLCGERPWMTKLLTRAPDRFRKVAESGNLRLYEVRLVV
jgi:hypothetical protein